VTNVYRVAVIGAGSGGRLSIKGALASPRYELVAVADVGANARSAIEAEFPGVRVFADHKQLLSECPLDLSVFLLGRHHICRLPRMRWQLV